MRRPVIGVADEAFGALGLGGAGADGGGVGHDLLHFRAGAVARIHGQEGGVRQGDAHLEGVVCGDAGGADFLQEDGFQVGQGLEAAGDVDQRLAGADPGAFGVHQLDVEFLAARLGDRFQPFDHERRGADHRAAEEDRVGDAPVAEAGDDGAGAVEIGVRAGGDVRVGERGRDHDGAAGAAGFQLLGDEEGEFQRLLGIQPRVAEGLVAVAEIVLREAARAADAFGDVLAGHFHMRAAGDGALRRVEVEEGFQLGDDVVEAPGFDLSGRWRPCCRASGRTARPGCGRRV